MAEKMTALRPVKPLPVPTPTSEPFWTALREQRVEVQYCEECGVHIFYPRSHCPGCLSSPLVWRTVSGQGRIHSFTIARAPTAPLFADEVPQLLAIIELNEGPRLTSTIVDTPLEAIAIGVSVEPVFDHRDGAVTLLRYRVSER